MFKRTLLLMLAIIAIIAVLPVGAQPAKAQDDRTLGFTVTFEDGRRPWQGDMLWILDGRGNPVAIRLSETVEGMIEIGPRGDFNRTTPVSEFSFFDPTIQSMSLARLNGEGYFDVAPYGNWDRGYRAVELPLFDWDRNPIVVVPDYIPLPPIGLEFETEGQCFDFMGRYDDGMARSHAVPFVDAAGTLYLAALAPNYSFMVAKDGDWTQVFVVNDLTYFSPAAGMDVTVSGVGFVNGYPASLQMQDWDGNTFQATLVQCDYYPYPWTNPHAGGGWN